MKLLGLGSTLPQGIVVGITREGVRLDTGVVLSLADVEKFFTGE
jgi:hypothetical protein